MNKVLFLDRDGIINEDYGHVHKIENFDFCEGIFDLCKTYQSNGYLIIIVTNQAGIAKGYYNEETLDILHKYMVEEFSKQNINISKIYHCPHHPDENCKCRKPNSLMFEEAIKEFDVDVTNSVMIGDKMSDLIAANKVGITNLYYKQTRYNEDEVDFKYKKI